MSRPSLFRRTLLGLGLSLGLLTALPSAAEADSRASSQTCEPINAEKDDHFFRVSKVGSNMNSVAALSDAVEGDR